MVLASLALGLGEDELRLWGRFDREALSTGELWRLITAHLVHLSWGHVWLNLVALGMMAVLFSDVMRASDWALASILSAASIDVGLFFFEPSVGWYVGLSGALHGMMIVGAFGLVKHYGPMGYVLLIGVAGKLIWEQSIGPIPLSESTSGGPVLVAAHFYGAIGGLLAQLTRIILRR
jgi:rhomboid family GlyGly-CTERM serine protease